MYRLTLQLHDQAQWHDVVAIAFVEPEKGLSSPCEFGYTSEYVKTHLEAYDSLLPGGKREAAVDFGSHRLQHAPAFLYDIAPAGAANRFLLRHIGCEKPEGMGMTCFSWGGPLRRQSATCASRSRLSYWIMPTPSGLPIRM